MIIMVSVISAVIIVFVFALYYWSLSKGYAVMPEASKVDPLPSEEEIEERNKL
ncbi:hypothetical protein [Bacillus solimangrovi]|uniref:hypothetical protein n=1 Tax=Bacillus solimangrovi TaxID=1305675 RepID=UPI00158665D2|nr:hypothetical protein [Bacillus solimangrovi]